VIINSALDAIDKFIKICKELAGLPALVLPQYGAAAAGLYQICQKLLKANENVARWLYKFQYFDFQPAEAKTRFLVLCVEYSAMKIGPERRELKFRCGDIENIYDQEIASKVGTWFTKTERATEVEAIFRALTTADETMVDHVEREVIGRIDSFVAEIERFIDADDLNGAEAARLRFKTAMAAANRALEQFSGDLSELVLQFARIGRVPVTL
jgi:hypothetical protein